MGRLFLCTSVLLSAALGITYVKHVADLVTRWKRYAKGLAFAIRMTTPRVLVNVALWAFLGEGPKHVCSILFRSLLTLRQKNDLRAQTWNRRLCHLFWGTKHVLIPPSVRCDLLPGRSALDVAASRKAPIWNPRLYLQNSGDPFPSILAETVECDTSRCELTRMTHFRLRDKGWILWVGDRKTGAILPYVLREERAAELEAARLCSIPSSTGRATILRSASSECLNILRSVGAIMTSSQMQWTSERHCRWITEMRSEVGVKGVTPVKKLFRPSLVRALRHYYMHGDVRFPRRDSVGIHSVFSEPLARHLNHQLKPLAEQIVGRKLRDSSPLILAYGPESNLTIHTDHVPFAVSLSVSLGCAKDEAVSSGESKQSTSSIFCITWDLSCPITEISMEPGDGVCFLGQTIPHYRNMSGASLANDDRLLSLSMGWHYEEDGPVVYEDGMYAFQQSE